MLRPASFKVANGFNQVVLNRLMLPACLRNYTHLFGLNNCDWSLELKVLFKSLVNFYVFALVADLLLQFKVTFSREVSPNVSLNHY